MKLEEQLRMAFPIRQNIAAGQHKMQLWSIDVEAGFGYMLFHVKVGNKIETVTTIQKAAGIIE